MLFFNVKTSFSSLFFHLIAPVHLCEVAEQSFPDKGAHVGENVPEGIDVIDADQRMLGMIKCKMPTQRN